MNAMNRVLSAPKELMRFCQTSPNRKRLKLSKLKDKSDSGVKQESSDDFKDYAETTMNELLGWYGYEKLDTGDTKDLNLKHFTSNKKSDSKTCLATNTSDRSSTASNRSKDENRFVLSPYSGSDGGEGVGSTAPSADSTGVCRSASPPLTTTTESNDENGLENKDCSEDNQNIPPGCIVCAWCAKVGIKLFTLRTVSGSKAFCSELCFTQCRRASFKKNKICDWCKHVRHTVNYVDFQDGEQQLQFCSNKCLNQYKMNIFCNETKAHLHLNPSLAKDTSKQAHASSVSNLITPELWLKDLKSGENENSFNDSSDLESDLELEDSQPLPVPSLKRKCSVFSKENNDIKANQKESPIKESPIKEKSIKESKRVKHSHKVSNSCRQTTGAKHSNTDFYQSNDRSSRESNDKSLNFQSSYRGQRHSPVPPSGLLHRTSMTAPNLNIPLLNGSSDVRINGSLNPMAANCSPSAPLFPRMPESRADPSIRNPMLPPPTFGPRGPSMSNFFGPQMEMLLRMQSNFAGWRHPFPPFPPHPPNVHPFAGLPNLNGVHPTNRPSLIQPPLQSPQESPQMYPNFSLLPPITIMTPYPVPIPIPIPIPVPILFPIDKNMKPKNNNNNNNVNISSCNDVTTTTRASQSVSGNNTCATTTSKVESVISKLVEKSKGNDSKNTDNNHNKNIESVVDNSLDLSRRTEDNKSGGINDNQTNSDNTVEALPQNLVVSRYKRSVGLPLTAVPKLGYRIP